MSIQRIEVKDGIVTRMPTKDKKTLTPEGVEKIFTGLRDVLTRIIKLENVPTREPPRAMSLPEAVNASQSAHAYAIAKQHQEYARRILPDGQVPTHPDIAAKEAREEAEASNYPHHEGTQGNEQAPTHDVRGRIAPLRHVTFTNRTRTQPDR